MNKIVQKLIAFRDERDWKKFHTPQNIAKSIVLEAAELLEIFQWKKTNSISEKDKKEISEEMADIYNWLLLMSHDLNIDLEDAALKKIDTNAKKYPVEKSRGKAKKYTQL